MFDIDNNTEPNLQRLVNLYSFLVIFLMQENVKNTSPDYLIEKWKRWIGTDVQLKQNTLRPEDIVAFDEYLKRWRIKSEEVISAVREIFYFIHCINETDLRNWIHWFEYFGGDIMKIRSDRTVGLHPIAYQKVKSLIQEEYNIVLAFIRQMKLTQLEDEA